MPRNTSGRLALAVSSVSLVVAMGGVTYAAATIGTAQLKNNAVTSAKIKNNNVTGKDVKESTLAKVPSAAAADSAGNAAKVGGLTVKKVRYQSAANTPTVLASVAGLTITASCNTNDLVLVATTTKSESSFYSSMVDLENDVVLTTDFESGDFDSTDTADMIGGGDSSEEDPGLITFAYDSQDGSAVTGTLSTDNDAGAGNNACTVAGTVIGG